MQSLPERLGRFDEAEDVRVGGVQATPRGIPRTDRRPAFRSLLSILVMVRFFTWNELEGLLIVYGPTFSL